MLMTNQTGLSSEELSTLYQLGGTTRFSHRRLQARAARQAGLELTNAENGNAHALKLRVNNSKEVRARLRAELEAGFCHSLAGRRAIKTLHRQGS